MHSSWDCFPQRRGSVCLSHTRTASRHGEASPAAGLEQAVLEGEGDAGQGSTAPCPFFLDPCARADGGAQPSPGRRHVRDITHGLRRSCLRGTAGCTSPRGFASPRSNPSDFPARQQARGEKGSQAAEACFYTRPPCRACARQASERLRVHLACLLPEHLVPRHL